MLSNLLWAVSLNINAVPKNMLWVEKDYLDSGWQSYKAPAAWRGKDAQASPVRRELFLERQLHQHVLPPARAGFLEPT